MRIVRLSAITLLCLLLSLTPINVSKADSNTSSCKIASANGNRTVNLGWPRSDLWLKGLGKTQFLVVGIDFSNARYSGSVKQMVEGFDLAKVKSFYEKASYGKMKLDFTYVDEIINLPISDLSVYDRQIANEVVKLIPKSYKLSDYDGLIGIVTNTSSYSASTALPGYPLANDTGSFSSAAIIAGISSKVSRWSNWMTVAHEIGHLLGLMDLWNRQDALAWEGKTGAPFSLMNTGAGWTYAPDFYGWEKWLVGWISDSDVTCLVPPIENIEISLNALSDPVGNKLVVIPISSTKVVAIEKRQRGELDAGIQKFGPLVYEVDLTKDQFQVPITLKPSAQALQQPFSIGLPDWKRFSDAPLSPFEVIDIGSQRIANLDSLKEKNLLISGLPADEILQVIESLRVVSGTGTNAPAAINEKKETGEKLPVDNVVSEKPSGDKKLTITCQKGKLIKKITGLKPKCPKGYRKR